MRRTQSVAAALSVAFIATGVAGSSAAAPRQILGLPIKLDLGGLEDELRGLGLNPTQILDVTSFLGKGRDEQSALLRRAGIVDPGGDLNDSFVADFILGQYLLKSGGDKGTGIRLQLQSGKLDAQVAIQLGQSLKPLDIKVTDTEIEQQRSAQKTRGGILTREQAELRARLQRVITLLRPYLFRLVPNAAEVYIDDEKLQVVVSTAGPIAEVTKALGKLEFAGLPIEVRSAKLSKASLGALVSNVREVIDREAPGAKVMVGSDPIESVVTLTPADKESDAKVRGAKGVAERLKAGDTVVKPVKAGGPSAVIGGHGTTVGGCTWGFAASNGNAKMLTTAGHCVGESGYPFVATSFVEEYWYGTTDAARHTTDPYFYDLFDNYIVRSGLPDLEITSRTGWASVGYNDVICHQGAGSGHSCGYVTDLYAAPWWVSGANRFIYTTAPTLNDQGADSGGPWFYGNSAYGIHSGGCKCFGNWSYWGWSVFGAIDFAEANTHFTVLTK